MKGLQVLSEMLMAIDEDLKQKAGICPKCGKPQPQGGVVLRDQTKEAAGLCVCNFADEGEERSGG